MDLMLHFGLALGEDW